MRHGGVPGGGSNLLVLGREERGETNLEGNAAQQRCETGHLTIWPSWELVLTIASPATFLLMQTHTHLPDPALGPPRPASLSNVSYSLTRMRRCSGYQPPDPEQV